MSSRRQDFQTCLWMSLGKLDGIILWRSLKLSPEVKHPTIACYTSSLPLSGPSTPRGVQKAPRKVKVKTQQGKLAFPASCCPLLPDQAPLPSPHATLRTRPRHAPSSPAVTCPVLGWLPWAGDAHPGAPCPPPLLHHQASSKEAQAA